MCWRAGIPCGNRLRWNSIDNELAELVQHKCGQQRKDQDLNEDCFDFLGQLRDLKNHGKLIWYKKQNITNLNLYELSSHYKLLNILENKYLKKIANKTLKQKIFISCNLKRDGADLFCKYIIETYPTLRVKNYTSDTSDADKQALGEC